jgi:hypothetical protein
MTLGRRSKELATNSSTATILSGLGELSAAIGTGNKKSPTRNSRRNIQT